MTAKPKTRTHKLSARKRRMLAQKYLPQLQAAARRCVARAKAYDAITSPSGPKLADRWWAAFTRIDDFINPAPTVKK